ncbi:DUF6567 family protein [Brumimicrobium oceani]|nr:DUF6567 family protein [Brumimicrobium oceani]
MKNLIRLLSFCVFATFLNSCAFHSGVMTGNAALSDANFKVVDYAVGTSETFKVFGLGGVATDALVLEAKRNLYKNYPLKAGQALANVSVDFKRSFFPVVSKNKVVVSADIIDFNTSAIAKSESQSFPLGSTMVAKEGYNDYNEVVYFKYQGEYKLGKIVGYGRTQAKVLVTSVRDRMLIRRVPKRKLFFRTKSKSGVETKFNIGSEVFYEDDIVDDNGVDRTVKRFGKIFAFGQKGALVEYNIDDVPIFFFVTYDRLTLRPHSETK